MNNKFENLKKAIFNNCAMRGLIPFNSESMGAEKNFEETGMKQAYTINLSAIGYKFREDDIPERLIKSFIASVATFLGKVKITSANEAVALVFSDMAGNFKMAGIVEYHENKENNDEPGNWSFVMTFNEDDVTDLEKIKSVKKYLCGDNAFRDVFDKVAYDIGGVEMQHSSYIYNTCMTLIDTFLEILDAEAVEGETVDIEIPGYCTLSVETSNDDKTFAITPDGAMKVLIKSDVALDKNI